MYKKYILTLVGGLLISGAVFAQEANQDTMSSTQTATMPVLEAQIVIAKQVVDREPVERADTFSVSDGQLVGWTKITGAQEPTKVIHAWSREGQDMAPIELDVRSSSYRTWSRVTLGDQPGKWTLTVKDLEGHILSSKSVEVKQATDATMPTP